MYLALAPEFISKYYFNFRGENSLIASAVKRNSKIEGDVWVKIGQKTDLIGSLYVNRLEIMLIEFASPGEQLYGTKARTDKLKLMQGMKDALNRLLLTSLRGSNSEDLQNVFVIGVQVVGMFFCVYACSLNGFFVLTVKYISP